MDEIIETEVRTPTIEEVAQYAKERGVELTEEQISQVSAGVAGWETASFTCHKCHKENVVRIGTKKAYCSYCGEPHVFKL